MEVANIVSVISLKSVMKRVHTEETMYINIILKVTRLIIVVEEHFGLS